MESGAFGAPAQQCCELEMLHRNTSVGEERIVSASRLLIHCAATLSANPSEGIHFFNAICNDGKAGLAAAVCGKLSSSWQFSLPAISCGWGKARLTSLRGAMMIKTKAFVQHKMTTTTLCNNSNSL